MKPTIQLPYEDIVKVATEGSPVLLRSVGRVVGLGQAETSQLLKKGIPTWALCVVTLGAGFVVGAWAYKKWPAVLGKVVGRR